MLIRLSVLINYKIIRRSVLNKRLHNVFNKILYLLLNPEKKRLFLDCCVRRVLGWGDVIMRYIVPSCFVMWGDAASFDVMYQRVRARQWIV